MGRAHGDVPGEADGRGARAMSDHGKECMCKPCFYARLRKLWQGVL